MSQLMRPVKTEVAWFEQDRIQDFKKNLGSIQARGGFQQLLLRRFPVQVLREI